MFNVQFPTQSLSAVTTAIKDGTHGTHRRVAEGVPLLSAKNITANGEIAFDYTDDRISESEYLDLARSFRLEPDDLLLTIVGSLGRRAIYSGQRITFQRSVAYIRPQQQKMRSRFLFHWMGHSAFSAELKRRSNATAQAGLYLGELAKVSVPVPEVREQKAIAQILDTLDTAIHETEAIIAKLKAVKQGLLHDLLTRGIDANGELRPPQAEAPHLYKDSPLGWIPKEWDFDVISNLTTSSAIGPFGSDLVASDYRKAGVPVVFVRDVKPDCLSWKSNIYVSAGKAQALAAHKVVPGDVVATKMGLPPCVAAVYPDSMPNGVVTADIVRLRPDLNRILPGWMSAFINAPAVSKQVEQITAGVTRLKVTLRDVRNLHLAVPEPREQRLLLEHVDAIEARLRAEEQCLHKLLAQQSGLMDDLLTGRVRVTPLLAGAEREKEHA